MARMTNKERLRRLRLLRDKLKTVDKGHYKHSTWGAGSDMSDGACGSPACALGWACRMPEFRRIGLRQPYVEYNDYAPVLRGHEGAEAGRVLFGLSDDEAALLFDAFHPGTFKWAGERTVKQEIKLLDLVITTYEAKC